MSEYALIPDPVPGIIVVTVPKNSCPLITVGGAIVGAGEAVPDGNGVGTIVGVGV